MYISITNTCKGYTKITSSHSTNSRQEMAWKTNRWLLSCRVLKNIQKGCLAVEGQKSTLQRNGIEFNGHISGDFESLTAKTEQKTGWKGLVNTPYPLRICMWSMLSNCLRKLCWNSTSIIPPSKLVQDFFSRGIQRLALSHPPRMWPRTVGMKSKKCSQ